MKNKDPLIQERISQDLWDGNSADVRGTPTVFINGKRLRDRTLPGFQKVIDMELTKNRVEKQLNRLLEGDPN